MKKETAKLMVRVVNDPDYLNILLAYVDEQIDMYHGWLETERDIQKINYMQGCIAELKKFKTLRDEVNAEVKRN